MEAILRLAPIEIGNRVWIDTNKDGIQDAGETPLSGITVSLYAADGTTLISTATTDANGAYYFSNTIATNTSSAKYNLDIDYATAYVLKFPTTSGTYALTTKDINTNTSDFIDSDAATDGTISFTTGTAGDSNHSFDVGYAPAPCQTIMLPSSAQSICVGDAGANIITQTDLNTANSIKFVQFTSDQMAGTTPTATEATNIYAGTSIATVTPTGASSPYTATYTWNSADFPNTTNEAIIYYVYAILEPNTGATCQPVQEIKVTVSPTVTAGIASNQSPIHLSKWKRACKYRFIQSINRRNDKWRMVSNRRYDSRRGIEYFHRYFEPKWVIKWHLYVPLYCDRHRTLPK